LTFLEGLLKLSYMANVNEVVDPTTNTVEYTYTVFFEAAPEGGYLAHVPALGFVTEGETLEEARLMAADAIHGVLETRRQYGEMIPEDVQEDGGRHKERISVALTL
jgi:predicted RNase H-like HicB family nuclease